jgi:type IV pilus biogenesis/stability protein PilW
LRIVAVAFVVAGGMLLSCSAPTANMKKEASARMEMGVTYLEQNNLPAAMRELTQASELDPENPKIDMTLGLAYQKRGDLEKAEEYLRRAVRKKPDYAEAHNNLGNLLSLRGKSEEAIREYEKAVANVLYPTPEYGYYNMGREYALLKDLPKAEAMYQRAISLRPSFAEAYRGLAMVQVERGKWKESVRTLEKMVKIAPFHARGWMDLGRLYLRLDHPGKALEAFRSAMANSEDPGLRAEAARYIDILEQGRR